MDRCATNIALGIIVKYTIYDKLKFFAISSMIPILWGVNICSSL